MISFITSSVFSISKEKFKLENFSPSNNISSQNIFLFIGVFCFQFIDWDFLKKGLGISFRISCSDRSADLVFNRVFRIFWEFGSKCYCLQPTFFDGTSKFIRDENIELHGENHPSNRSFYRFRNWIVSIVFLQGDWSTASTSKIN